MTNNKIIHKRIMTWISLCLLLFVFANTKSETSPGNELARKMNALLQEPSTESPEKNSKKDGDECDVSFLNNIVCENDTLTFCGPDNKITSIPCIVNGRPGFCNCEKTACVREKPTCSEEKSKCLQPNTKFPDNLDCHKFSYCNQKNEKITIKCPGNLIYDPKEEKCTDQKTIRCKKIVCPRFGDMPQLIPFPQAKNYYVLCYKGMGDVRKCSDKYYAIRNNICQFECELKNATGLFKDSNLEKCKKGIYYACKKERNRFTTIQLQCPTDLTFDEKLEICTQEDTCTEPSNGF